MCSSLFGRQRCVSRPVPAFSSLNSFGDIRNTRRVRVGIGRSDAHQQRLCGQKHR
jgi:hypothetical protein